jgi:hypothetical protein
VKEEDCKSTRKSSGHEGDEEAVKKSGRSVVSFGLVQAVLQWGAINPNLWTSFRLINTVFW